MAFDPNTGQLTPEPERFSKHQLVPLLYEAEHGAVGYMLSRNWWADPKGDPYIEGCNNLFPSAYLHKLLDSVIRDAAQEAECEESTFKLDLSQTLGFCRVARIYLPELKLNGCLLDESANNFVANGCIEERVQRTTGPMSEVSGIIVPPQIPLPVLAWAGNLMQLSSIEAAMSKEPYKIKLGQSVLEVFQEYEQQRSQ